MNPVLGFTAHRKEGWVGTVSLHFSSGKCTAAHANTSRAMLDKVLPSAVFNVQNQTFTWRIFTLYNGSHWNLKVIYFLSTIKISAYMWTVYLIEGTFYHFLSKGAMKAKFQIASPTPRSTRTAVMSLLLG